jgi:two-component system, chemotaxis family, protein-glutamate methylesterase/glutaminase
MTRTRVVVVDDSALVRSLLSEIIGRQPDMQCVGVAADPYVAREMIRELDPDVITLDVEMPRMDGLDFLSKLMRLRPMPVVMVSTLTERGAEVTMRALELGAVDFVAKPKIGVADGLRQLADDIADKIRAAARARIRRAPAAAAAHGGPASPLAPAIAPRPLGRLSTEKIVFSVRPPVAPKPRRTCSCSCRRIFPRCSSRSTCRPGSPPATPGAWTGCAASA